MLDFTKGNPWALMLRFSAPMLLSNVLMQLYHVADTYIVGNYLGTTALAAVGVSAPVVFALISFIVGIAVGCTIIISQYFGAGNIAQVRRAFDTIVVFVIAAALCMMAVGLALCDPLLHLVRTPDDVFADARTFYRISILGILPLFGVNVLSATLRGLGDAKTPLYFMIVSSLLNVALLLLFVPYFGWGIRGAAWATIAAQTLTVAAMVIQLRRHPVIRIGVRPANFDIGIFGNSVRIGLPNGIQQALVAVGMMALLGIINDFNDSSLLAAYNVAGRIDSIVSVPAMTFSMAIASFVGQNVGARKFERVSAGLRATLGISIIMSVALSAAVIALRTPLMRLFATDAVPSVIDYGSRYLLIICAFYVVFNVMFVFNGVLRGAGDTIITMIITLLSLWFVRIPVASIASKVIGPDGIWWSIPAGWCVGMVCIIGYYRFGRWKNKGVVKPNDPAPLTIDNGACASSQ